MIWIKRAFLSLPFICLVALTIRIGFAWNYVHLRPHRALGTIPFLFEPGNIAFSLITGKGYSSPFHVESGPTAWMTPVYPLILAAIFKLFGAYTFAAFVAAVGLNIASSTLTCIPIYAVGRKLDSIPLAACAAWLWAIFPNTILNTFQSLWDASLGSLLAAVILWATLKLAETKRWTVWAAYGLLWGFALMTNASLLSLLPFLLGWAAYRTRKEGRSTIRNATLAAGIAILCCVPWAIRNYVAMHSWIPIRSTLGLQLWLGNNSEIGDRWPGLLHPIGNSVERGKYLQQGEIAYMHEKREEALAYMKSHPAEEVRLTWNRIVAMWAGGSASPFSDLVQNHSAWFRWVLVFNLMTAALMAAGIIILWFRRKRFALPLTVFPLVFPCAYYLTVATPRYRLVIDPVVMLLSAVSLRYWLRPARMRSIGFLGLLALALSTLVTNAQAMDLPVPTRSFPMCAASWEDKRGIASPAVVQQVQAHAIIVMLEDSRFLVMQLPATADNLRKSYKKGDSIVFSAHISGSALIADSLEHLGSQTVQVAKSATASSESPQSIDPIILKTREQVNEYSKQLPDFTCEQTTQRYVKSPQKATWFAMDTISVEVLFSGATGETYRDLRINGRRITKPMMQVGGSVSSGEFGSLLRSTLRDVQPGDFAFVKQTRVERRPVREYSFRVARTHSDWEVASDFEFVIPAYHGHIWIDVETNSVLRVEREADEFPAAFPIRRVESRLEYGAIRLGTDRKSYLLPIKAEMKGCERVNGICNRNEITFERYRKYNADSKLIF